MSWGRGLVAGVLALALGVPALAAVVPAVPKVGARSFVLMDFDTETVLAARDPDRRMEPASLTKMMTSYVVFAELRAGRLKLEDRVRVSERAWRQQGSRMFIEVGTEVTIEDLLRGLIIQSGNDAATALAEHVAGDESAFAGLMNDFAKRLGLTGSHFVNASGLPDPEHYTTARDMALLAHALVRDFPDYYRMYREREFTYNGITQRNRNRLLWTDPSVDGLKTGHTASAGYCLVVSAKRGEMRLVAVVLGSKSSKARAREAGALLNYGFRFFETRRMYRAGEPVRMVRVWQGERERLALGLASDLYLTLPRGQHDRLDTRSEIDEQIVAPVARGARHGTLRVLLGEETLAERPLVVLEAVERGNLWRQASDYLRMLLR